MEYKIVIDNPLIDEYAEYYFEQHPRAHKKPIERPIHPSLNVYLSMNNRLQINALKQKWKQFGMWVVRKYGYDNLFLDSFELEVRVFMPTKRRYDCDNQCEKFLIDSLTESGMIVDDDILHLKKLIITGGYDKDNPRTELYIRTI